MTTSWTNRTVPTTTYTARPKFTVWLEYFRFTDGVDEHIFCDNNGDRLTFISKSGFQEIDGGTIWTSRPVI